MIQNIIARILLAPISLLYGIGISLRNFFYRNNLLKEVSFDLPIINVGNLSIGGAGKTPHIEYLIRLLGPYINLATLSRGYNRKTKGYLKVTQTHSVEEVGDEPLQYLRKFPGIKVYVSESRTFAIPRMIMEYPDMQTVLLDDAYQHRSILPGLNVLLTDYSLPYTRDYLLPSGRLREWRAASRRADMIVVSKCPDELSVSEKKKMIAELNPLPHQKVFFSFYQYLNPYYIFNMQHRIKLTQDLDVLLICAIARTDYLVDHLITVVNEVNILEYEDHHYFTNYDVSNLMTRFNNMESPKKIILTTEKDAMRLELHREFIIENKLPILVLPLKVAFHFDDGERFSADVKDFLLGFKS